MNSNYERTLDENFEKALNLCSTPHSYDDLISLLKTGNIPEKQYAALMLEELKTKEDAHTFLSNLINCDGKIREAVAQKFLEFTDNPEYSKYFADYPDILAKSTIDINANISRMVIEGLEKLKDFKNFGEKYSENLVKYINEAFEGLDKIVFRDKKYTINKQLFKLYWCLEGLKDYYKYLDKDTLSDILKKSMAQTEYTVREKAAQIIKQLPKDEFEDLYKLAYADKNYYVKQIMGVNMKG